MPPKSAPFPGTFAVSLLLACAAVFKDQIRYVLYIGRVFLTYLNVLFTDVEVRGPVFGLTDIHRYVTHLVSVAIRKPEYRATEFDVAEKNLKVSGKVYFVVFPDPARAPFLLVIMNFL